jgi:[acyl-carrier-protein] S-malonyltransferase
MGRLAFVFSGQGSQYTGMGKSLCEAAPAAAEVFRMADALRPGTSDQCFSAGKETLSLTQNTQPCVFCVDLAAAAALQAEGITPDYLAGFSLGEVPALAFGGYLSYKDAFAYVCRRGAVMDACAGERKGTMYAVLGLDTAAVETLCETVGGAWPVNYNCPGQTVVACREEAADALAAAVKAQKGRAMKLAVTGAFHSPLMEGAAMILAQAYGALTLQPPRIPVLSNLTARPYEGAGQMFAQVHSPVRWQEIIEYLLAQGVDTFVEVGPGKTLCGLITKQSKEAAVLHVEDGETLRAALAALRPGHQ